MGHHGKPHERVDIRHLLEAEHHEGEFGGNHLESSNHHDVEAGNGGGSLHAEDYNFEEEGHDDHHSSHQEGHHNQLRGARGGSEIDSGHAALHLEAVFSISRILNIG